MKKRYIFISLVLVIAVVIILLNNEKRAVELDGTYTNLYNSNYKIVLNEEKSTFIQTYRGDTSKGTFWFDNFESKIMFDGWKDLLGSMKLGNGAKEIIQFGFFDKSNGEIIFSEDRRELNFKKKD